MATALTGLAIWAVATVVIRAFGAVVFADILWIRMLFFAGSAVGVVAVVCAVSSLLRAPAEQVAIRLALPGMLLDAGALLFWERLFPELVGAERPFGALMLWVYACTLTAGLVTGHREE